MNRPRPQLASGPRRAGHCHVPSPPALPGIPRPHAPRCPVTGGKFCPVPRPTSKGGRPEAERGGPAPSSLEAPREAGTGPVPLCTRSSITASPGTTPHPPASWADGTAPRLASACRKPAAHAPLGHRDRSRPGCRAERLCRGQGARTQPAHARLSSRRHQDSVSADRVPVKPPPTATASRGSGRGLGSQAPGGV